MLSRNKFCRLSLEHIVVVVVGIYVKQDVDDALQRESLLNA